MPNPTPETLAEIVEAGKRATDRPWHSVEMYSRPERAYLAAGLNPIFASGSSMVQGGHAKVADADYLELAANHVDHMAATLLKVREIFSKSPRQLRLRIESAEMAGSENVWLTIDEARELLKILEGQ